MGRFAEAAARAAQLTDRELAKQIGTLSRVDVSALLPDKRDNSSD